VTAPSKGKSKENSSDDDEDDDDGEILEESPCGRWLKRREQVLKNRGHGPYSESRSQSYLI
jgi:hypothetical protein